MTETLKAKAKELADQLYAALVDEFLNDNLKFEDCINKTDNIDRICSLRINCTIIIDKNGVLTGGMESISPTGEDALWKHNESSDKWEDEEA